MLGGWKVLRVVPRLRFKHRRSWGQVRAMYSEAVLSDYCISVLISFCVLFMSEKTLSPFKPLEKIIQVP